jgi:hypothetical protein
MRGEHYLAAGASPFHALYAALGATTGEFHHETCPTEEAWPTRSSALPRSSWAVRGRRKPSTPRGRRCSWGSSSRRCPPRRGGVHPPGKVEGLPAGVIPRRESFGRSSITCSSSNRRARDRRVSERAGSAPRDGERLCPYARDLLDPLRREGRGVLLWAVTARGRHGRRGRCARGSPCRFRTSTDRRTPRRGGRAPRGARRPQELGGSLAPWGTCPGSLRACAGPVGSEDLGALRDTWRRLPAIARALGSPPPRCCEGVRGGGPSEAVGLNSGALATSPGRVQGRRRLPPGLRHRWTSYTL